jgi:ferredoxin
VAFNLLKLEFVRRVFNNTMLRHSVQAGIAALIALIILSGAAGNQRADANIAIVLTWGLWEPALVISTFFAGRLWCSVCPIGAASSWLDRTVGLRRKVPRFLREHGIYFSAAALALIFWSESASGMLDSPRATAVLIFSVVLGAVAIGLLYRRRAWCRFLCPLGGMVGLLSSCSIIEMRANYNICNNDCTTHACYAGEGTYEGCPMYEGPFSLSSNLNCILCGKCISVCPNRSPVLNLRLPAHELWTTRSPEKGLVALGLALIATQVFRGLEMAGYFGLRYTGLHGWWMASIPIFLGLFAATYLAFGYLSRRAFSGSRIDAARAFGLFIYGLIPLAAAFEVAFHMGRLLTMGGSLLQVIGRQLDWHIGFPAVTVDGTALKVFQLLLILIGSFASLGVFSKLLMSARACENPERSGIRSVWPLLVLSAAYFWFFMRAGS